jgi:teichuronic acid exporter
MSVVAVMVSSAKHTTVSGLRARLATPFVRGLGSLGGAQIAMRVSRLVTTVILTRLLSPNDYGLAAIVLTAYEMVSLFTRNGISATVVQASDSDVGTVAETAYWLTWIVCIALLIVQLGIALPLAWIYGDPRLVAPIALMSLIYLATPACNIQCVMLERERRLGRIALASGLQVTIDNLLTAVFAVLGMGMWAIVLPKLLVAPIWVVLIRRGHDWRPASPWWPKDRMIGWRPILKFSRHVVGVEMLTTVQANFDNLAVGYFLGIEALGVYYFAFNAGLGITLGLVNSFRTAVYPHLCEVRADRVALTERYHDSLRTLGTIVVPLVLLQVALAPIYVPLVFGEKWTAAIPVLMIICLSALPRPFATTCSQLLKAVGRPDIEFRWQLALTSVLGVVLVLATRSGIIGVAIAVLVVQTVVLTAYCLRAPRPFVDGFRRSESGATLS